MSRLPKLPPEVLSIVTSHLRPQALRQCLLVNSAFNALVQPQLFCYISASGDMMVPTFSLIRDSSTTRALGVTGVVDLDHPIPSDLSRLTVHAHSHCCWGEREPFSSPSGSSVISSCRVLKIHLASPDDMDSLTSAHSNYYNLDGDEPDPTPEGPFVRSLQCHILHHSLENACIDKLVLRGVPVIYGNVNPDLFASSAFETVKEAVLVFDIDSMNSTNASTVDTYRTDCFECSRTEHEGTRCSSPASTPAKCSSLR